MQVVFTENIGNINIQLIQTTMKKTASSIKIEQNIRLIAKGSLEEVWKDILLLIKNEWYQNT